MPITATPFLMFQGAAEEALDLYVAVFPESRVVDVERYVAGEPGPEGKF
ncbi:MAG TPA: VOC family protein [Trueperaceae bacterium]|nr:VOC family protein [Trueperaceae bacterium]